MTRDDHDLRPASGKDRRTTSLTTANGWRYFLLVCHETQVPVHRQTLAIVDSLRP